MVINTFYLKSTWGPGFGPQYWKKERKKKCCAIIITYFQNIFSPCPPKIRHPVPISNHSHSSLPPSSPWQLQIYFLSLWNCLSRTFYTNGIIRCVAFCVWPLLFSTMGSRSFCTITYIFHSFLWNNILFVDTPYFFKINSFTDGCELFPLFSYYEYCNYDHLSTSFRCTYFSVLLNIHLRVELCHMVILWGTGGWTMAGPF